MKNKSAWLLVTVFSAISYAQADTAWEGPSQAPGAGLSNLAKPTNFIDVNGLGTWGDNPYTDTRIRLNYVLYQNEVDTVQINAHANQFHLDEALPLPSSPDPFSPRSLWSTAVGATYSHKLEQGEWGLIGSVGSDSDQPFNSIHEVSLQLTGTYRKPVDQLHSWIFFLNYSNDRAFAANVPIPGASYLVIDPDKHLVVSYGLPFFLDWHPVPEIETRLVYFIPTIINAEINYKFFKSYKAHIGFDWFPQAWSPANRSDTKDRFIFDQKKASLGFKGPVWNDWFADITTGYVFDQKIFEAEDLFSKDINKTYLQAGVFLQGELAYRF